MYFCVHMYHDICEVSTSCRSRLSPLFHHVGPSCLFLMSHLASPLIYSLTVFLFVCVCVLSVYQCADPCTCLGGKGADWHALRYCCPPQFWDRISIPFCFSVAVMNHSDLEAACGGKGYFIFSLPSIKKSQVGDTRQELETDLWGSTDYRFTHKLAFGLMVS